MRTDVSDFNTFIWFCRSGASLMVHLMAKDRFGVSKIRRSSCSCCGDRRIRTEALWFFSLLSNWIISLIYLSYAGWMAIMTFTASCIVIFLRVSFNVRLSLTDFTLVCATDIQAFFQSCVIKFNI